MMKAFFSALANLTRLVTNLLYLKIPEKVAVQGPLERLSFSLGGGGGGGESQMKGVEMLFVLLSGINFSF